MMESLLYQWRAGLSLLVVAPPLVVQQPSFTRVAGQPALAEPPHPPAAIPDAGAADRDSDCAAKEETSQAHLMGECCHTQPSYHIQSPPQQDLGGGWGTRDSHRLGTSVCQVLVRYLPRDYLTEQLMAYVREMLRNNQVNLSI